MPNFERKSRFAQADKKWQSTGNVEEILENVTHAFMDLILMMGIAGTGNAGYVNQPTSITPVKCS